MPVDDSVRAAYFRNYHPSLSLLAQTPEGRGFRRSQLGAIYAIGSHFTVHDSAAMVVLPTGAGKTGVLMVAPYLLNAKRVLVVTPSRLLRDQIATEFSSLRLLRSLGALPDAAARPTVKVVRKKLGTKKLWNQLRECSVIVGTPQVLSPGSPGVTSPPRSMFDLVLIDEAHHSPARTWQGVIDTFPDARRVLFTATPFRRDRREIKGRLAYSYPLRRAMVDGIYCKIRYQPVVPAPGQSSDAAVARAAQAALAADRARGLRHLLMVRTDSKKRAAELEQTYARETQLKLRVIHSGYSQKIVDDVIAQLRRGELDGVIAVSMMGEGFDLPELKVAAIHAPHKSLEVTLQFIGRFARTAGEGVGDATFLAVPNDVEVAAEQLYREDAVWQELVPNLSETRVGLETRVREGLASFVVEGGRALDSEEAISLYDLRPRSHTKIYDVGASGVDIETPVKRLGGLEVVFRATSEELSASVFITRETTQPRWTAINRFQAIAHDLVVVHYEPGSKLLFISSSRGSTGFYESVASIFTAGGHKILPLFQVNRVLRGLKDLDCFSLGMRTRVRGKSAETYRIMAGSKAQKALGPTEGRLFDRGHVFAKAVTPQGEQLTIGYSSSSKVWSHKALQLPELVAWCRNLATQLESDAPVTTGTELERLPISSPALTMPSNIVAVDWHEDVYDTPLELRGGEPTERCLLLDCELALGAVTDSSSAKVALRTPWREYSVTYALGERKVFKPDGEAATLVVESGDEAVDLGGFLNNHYPSFYLADFSRLSGEELFVPPTGVPPYDKAKARAWQWNGVDIENEAGPATRRGQSIQDYVESILVGSAAQVVVKDHGTGEVADFISVEEEADAVNVRLYHCKASGASRPGRRVNDLYEVCGQVVKSVWWAERPEVLVKRIRARVANGSQLAKGDLNTVSRLLVDAPTKPIRYTLTLVQPGLAISQLEDAQWMVVAAADHYARAFQFAEMAVWASA